MAAFLSIIVTILLFLINVDCKTKKRFTREPKCGDTKHFRFDEELPTYNRELSYCKYYRGETCCNKSHTDRIIKNIYIYHEKSVSSDCRDVSLNIGCSPCDPRIGTNQIKGICQSYCDHWYDVCRNDYFRFDSRGILTACSELDIVCSKLSLITKNGSKLCQLSGFDVSHISINCYNGKKSKFKSPPKSKEWQTPFGKVFAVLKSSVFGKNINIFINSYSRMALWQQMFIIGGFAYSLFALFKVITNLWSHFFGIKEETTSKVPHNIFKDELEKIRNKRLEKFAKQTMINNQLNMEAKLAKELGLENELHDLHGDQSCDLMTGNHANNQDISLSDD